jgi:hypothetical protein
MHKMGLCPNPASVPPLDHVPQEGLAFAYWCARGKRYSDIGSNTNTRGVFIVQLTCNCLLF